ncbi:MAG: M24 family metallopeptidase [Burkholderiaceae bacterium]
MIEQESYQARRAEARRRMAGQGIDALLVGPSAAFRYFTGRKAIQTERFVALLIGREGSDLIVTPRLQSPLYDGIDGTELLIWDEAESPVARVAQELDRRGAGSLAVNEEFWSGFLLALRRLRPALNQLDGAPLLSALRIIKSEAELARMARTAERIDDVWTEFCRLTPTMIGHTELALRARIDGLMRDMGFSEVTWVDVGAGANGASPLHHGSEHVVAAGEPVVFDYAGCYDGYYGDICRIAVSGPIDPDYRALYDLVDRAQEAAFQAIRPGVTAESIDAVARRILSDAGYGEYFTHRIGHGIGLAAHEDPYLVEGNQRLLEPGMVFSNEPGVYLPGRWGVRIEDIVVVTRDGAQRLTRVSRELVSLNDD